LSPTKGCIRFTAYISALAVTVALAAPVAVASDRSIALAADRGTPKTLNSSWKVSQHVSKAREIIAYSFKQRDPNAHRYTAKRKRRVERHRSTIVGDGKARAKINRSVKKQRNAWRKWSKAELAGDQWEQAYRALSPAAKSTLHGLAICESSNRNLVYGWYSWTHWSALWSLLAGHPFLDGLPRNVQAASFEAQSVVTWEIGQRYGFGGFPACSAKLGI